MSLILLLSVNKNESITSILLISSFTFPDYVNGEATAK